MNNYNWDKEAVELLIPTLKNEIKIDWNLYLTLLYKQTPSRSKLQEAFAVWLKGYVLKKYSEIEITDINGTIYIIKGDSDLYPCAVSHIDTAQSYKPNMRVVKNEKWVYGFDLDTAGQCGIGADDKNGVLFCLLMLEKFEHIKICFFRNEETGCESSSAADPEFFSDCSMILQLDRNSFNNDLITYTNGVETCSDEFIISADKIMKKYEYSEATGSCTDIGAIKKLKGVNCVAMNISCGYINEHMSDEVVNIKAFENALNFGYELINNLQYRKWEHVSKITPYKSQYSRHSVHTLPSKHSKMYDGENIHDYVFNYVNGLDYICDYDIPAATIDQSLSYGFCPCCDCVDIQEDIDGMVYCGNCNSYFNIPESISSAIS